MPNIVVEKDLTKAFTRNGKEMAIPQYIIDFWNELKGLYDYGIIPFYNPRAMTYELMTSEEYEKIISHLYNTIRKGDNE